MIKSDADRSLGSREKKAQNGLAEVRGLWARKKDHAKLKILVGQFITTPERDEASIESAYKRLEDALKAWRIKS